MFTISINSFTFRGERSEAQYDNLIIRVIVTLIYLCDILQEKFEDTKGVIVSHKSNENIQYNDQAKKNETTSNSLQNITQKTKD